MMCFSGEFQKCKYEHPETNDERMILILTMRSMMTKIATVKMMIMMVMMQIAMLILRSYTR